MHDTNIIRLVVGPENKGYRVHKARLFVKIPLFPSLVSGNKEHGIGTRFRTTGFKEIESSLAKTPLLHVNGELVKDLPGNLEEGLELEEDEADEATTINFPAGDTSSWDILIRWVYHGSIPILETDVSKIGGWNWNPFAFYALVD